MANPFAKAGRRGNADVMSADEANKVMAALTPETKIKFVSDNQRMPHGAAYARYEAYKTATTITDAIAAGCSGGDFRVNLIKGWVKIIK